MHSLACVAHLIAYDEIRGSAHQRMIICVNVLDKGIRVYMYVGNELLL